MRSIIQLLFLNLTLLCGTLAPVNSAFADTPQKRDLPPPAELVSFSKKMFEALRLFEDSGINETKQAEINNQPTSEQSVAATTKFLVEEQGALGKASGLMGPFIRGPYHVLVKKVAGDLSDSFSELRKTVDDLIAALKKVDPSKPPPPDVIAMFQANHAKRVAVAGKILQFGGFPITMLMDLDKLEANGMKGTIPWRISDGERTDLADFVQKLFEKDIKVPRDAAGNRSPIAVVAEDTVNHLTLKTVEEYDASKKKL